MQVITGDSPASNSMWKWCSWHQIQYVIISVSIEDVGNYTKS